LTRLLVVKAMSNSSDVRRVLQCRRFCCEGWLAGWSRPQQYPGQLDISNTSSVYSLDGSRQSPLAHS
jgi:hypothetical protein